MPTYVTLVNFTEDGRKNIDELPNRIEKIKELKRSLGGEPLGFFITMLVGLGSVSYAIALTDLLYYEYRWAFQLAGLMFLLGACGVYLYTTENVCSVDAVVRKRRKILTLLGLALILAVIAYVIWLYVIVELVGVALEIW